jgi:hypothetical protein
VYGDLRPHAQIGSDAWEWLHERPLEFEALQRPLARGPVDAQAGFGHHPLPCLRVQIGEVAEGARGKEITFNVLDPCLHDALLRGICWRASIDLEAVPFGALGVCSLDEWIEAASARYCALAEALSKMSPVLLVKMRPPMPTGSLLARMAPPLLC